MSTVPTDDELAGQDAPPIPRWCCGCGDRTPGPTNAGFCARCAATIKANRS